MDGEGTLGATVSELDHGTLSSSEMFWQYQVGLYHMIIMPPSGMMGLDVLPESMRLGAVVVSLVDLSSSDASFTILFPTDMDGDGLDDNQEDGAVWNSESAIGKFDSDGDRLVDGYDGFVSVTHYPEGVDVNGNGYVDGERDSAIQTDPGNPDSDGDGVWDGQEVQDMTDPNDDTSFSFMPGDIAPLGAPNLMLNAADLVVAMRYVLGELTPVDQDVLNRIDLNANGGVDAGDLVILQQMIQAAP